MRRLIVTSILCFFAFTSYLQGRNNNLNNVWKDVRKIFMTLHEWFTDRRLNHMIGFLIHRGIKINNVLAWSQDSKKSEFDAKLVEEIRKNVFGGQVTRSELRINLEEQLRDMHYPRDRAKIRSILLIFNIATLLMDSSSYASFPFDKFKSEKWDIEHVRSIASDQPTNYNARMDWMEHCSNFLKNTTSFTALSEHLDKFIKLSRKDGEILDDDFDQLYDDVREAFKESNRTEESDNGIANLVLLDRQTNRRYQNAVFAVKRICILELDAKGIFVPLCTRNVFLKCYQ